MIKLLLYINVDMQVKCKFACNSVFQKDCGPFISQIQNINGTRKCRESGSLSTDLQKKMIQLF